MKDPEADKPGRIRNLTRVVTHNWALKLVALALAILIYYTLKPSAGFRSQGYHGQWPVRAPDHNVELPELFPERPDQKK